MRRNTGASLCRSIQVLGAGLGGVALYSTCAGTFTYADPGYESAIVAEDGCINVATITKQPLAHIKIFKALGPDEVVLKPALRALGALSFF